MTHTDNRHIHRLLAIEDAIDKVDKHLDIVALLRVRRKANKHKVTAHLNGCDAVHTRQDMREDMCDALSMTLDKCSAVLTQSLDSLLGNI